MFKIIHFLQIPVLALLIPALISPNATAQASLDPSRFEEDIRAFEAEDQADMPPDGAIVLTGSSSIARWNDQAEAALTPLTVIPRGFGGSVMGDVLYYLDRIVLKYNPRAILIYEGDNDTSFGIPNDTIISQFEQIVERIHTELPETRIYILSVKPSILRQSVWPQAQQVSRRLKDLAGTDPLIYFVDVATPFLQANGEVMTDIFVADNLHLNDLGNLIWGSVIRAALMPQEARHESGN